MKLLLDENISRRLVPALQDAFPGTSQVTLLGLERYSDREIWAFALANDFVIATKDEDFADLQGALGFPPKLVILKLGNTSNAMVQAALLNTEAKLKESLSLTTVGMVELYS